MSRKPLDLTNKRFGKLVALYSKRENNRTYWLCKCDCGNTKWIEMSHLGKKTQSCGCICIDIIQKARIDFEAKNMVEGTSLKGMTRSLNKNSSSGIKGVCFSPAVNKYVAYITFKGKKRTKRFDNIEDAIKWRKEQENIYFKPILEKYQKTIDKK